MDLENSQPKPSQISIFEHPQSNFTRHKEQYEELCAYVAVKMLFFDENRISGKHNAVFEAYYQQVDPKCSGKIEAMQAAAFLKRSGLSDLVLSRIWDLSDPKGRGYLDKSGFFVALKLVALAQTGSDVNVRNIWAECSNAPKVGEIRNVLLQTIPQTPDNKDWSIKPEEKAKYEDLFESLQPVNGMIAGNKVKGVLMESKLPLDSLGKIWDLADQDRDGSLDKHEFIVAMHLVYQALDKHALPSTLPAVLLRSNQIKHKHLGVGTLKSGFVANFPSNMDPPLNPPLPVLFESTQSYLHHNCSTITSATNSTMPSSNDTVKPFISSDWVVTIQDKAQYDVIFEQCDKDMDGLVSGFEVRNVFLKSGVQQNCLAHIWALCDTKQLGKLTKEQFALAMWLVEQKKRGFNPPDTLSYNMMPPTLRTSEIADLHADEQPSMIANSLNPELEMISRDINVLMKEKHYIEAELSQKEADIRIKSGEVRSLQSEWDTLVATLKQLEHQKCEAQKRLDDLKTQVNKIKEQCQKQEATIMEQEEEVDFKRSELQRLKDQENTLEKEYEEDSRQLDNLTKHLQDTQLEICQVKAMVTQLMETQRQMKDALILCKAVIQDNDASLLSDYSLKIEPELSEAKFILKKDKIMPKKLQNEFSNTININKDSNLDTGDLLSDSLLDATRMANDFQTNFSVAQISFEDEFISSSCIMNQLKDPFAAEAFGDTITNENESEATKDDFGSDPFAILHAPSTIQQSTGPTKTQKYGTPQRSESPSPALPPKKSRQPPPRPAPPRPMQGPSKPLEINTQRNTISSEFADFEEFPTTLPDPISMIMVKKNLHPMLTSQGSISINESNAKYTSSEIRDFCDDPFKDYRYDDPFNIKDPFDDEMDINNSSEGTCCRRLIKNNIFQELPHQKNSNYKFEKANIDNEYGRENQIKEKLEPTDTQNLDTNCKPSTVFSPTY